jgi:hypothetical protein
MSTTVSKWQTANNVGAPASTAEHEIMPFRDLPDRAAREEYKYVVFDTNSCPEVESNTVIANTYQVDGMMDSNQILLIQDTIAANKDLRIRLPLADVCAGQSIRIVFVGQTASSISESLYLETVKSGLQDVPFIGGIITCDSDSSPNPNATTIQFVSGTRIQFTRRPLVNSFIDAVSTGSSWVISGRVRSTDPALVLS